MPKTPPSTPQRPTGTTPPRGVGSSTSADLERAMALRDVVEHVVRVEREISGAKPLRAFRVRTAVALIVCVPLLGFSAWSLIARPSFIWGRPPIQSAEQADANHRVALVLLAQRIESFRAAHGRLPASLEEIGEAASGVRYTATSDSVFELSAGSGATALAYRSTEPADAFLADAMARIQGRPR